ncbi:hypothetical protein L1049_015068 [Liquidambar formosana]|uniref:RRM domain-containing protein n=1 Tax=Liquidambar formosana TaxID=63359 RepID=A0AAP0S3W8_LIQFO
MSILSGGSKSSKARWENMISVLMDNLPLGMDQVYLKNIFSWYGKVWDSFIPNKKRKGSNSKFGFIRFESIEEARTAIFRLNGVAFRHLKLIVKLANFGWDSLIKNSSTYERECSKNGNHHFSSYKPMSHVGDGVSTEVASDGVVNNKENGFESIVAEEVDEEWLLRCAIGELHFSEEILGPWEGSCFNKVDEYMQDFFFEVKDEIEKAGRVMVEVNQDRSIGIDVSGFDGGIGSDRTDSDPFGLQPILDRLTRESAISFGKPISSQYPFEVGLVHGGVSCDVHSDPIAIGVKHVTENGNVCEEVRGTKGKNQKCKSLV